METEQEVREQRLAEIVRYAQQRLGSGASQRASQRALSERLSCAPTMIGRYLTGNVVFGNMRAETVRALAEAAELDVGTLFVWIERGRDAAMAHEQHLRGEPVAFQPVDLARRLVTLLEASPAAAVEQDPPQVDVQGLMTLLEETRRESSRLFDRMVRALNAEAMLQRLAIGEPEEDDWRLLGALLEQSPQKLRQRFGPERLATPASPAAVPPAAMPPGV